MAEYRTHMKIIGIF